MTDNKDRLISTSDFLMRNFMAILESKENLPDRIEKCNNLIKNQLKVKYDAMALIKRMRLAIIDQMKREKINHIDLGEIEVNLKEARKTHRYDVNKIRVLKENLQSMLAQNLTPQEKSRLGAILQAIESAESIDPGKDRVNITRKA